jgi:hypothetical protein
LLRRNNPDTPFNQKDPVHHLQNERDKKRPVQAVTFAPAPTIHHYNPVASPAELPPPVAASLVGVGAVMSQ